MSSNVKKEINITESSGNVFEDLGIPHSAEYLAKANLARQINAIIKDRDLKQKEAAELLGIDQPKISAMNRGQLSGFSMERLIGFLNRLDQDVKIIVTAKPVRRRDSGRLKVAFV